MITRLVKNSRPGKAIFVGEHFTESQLLWVLPIVLEFAKGRGCDRIIFDRPLPRAILRNKVLAEQLSVFSIRHFKATSKARKLILWPLLFTEIRRLVRLSFLARQDLLNKNQTWLDCQLAHAVWDAALRGTKDGIQSPPRFTLFLTAVRVIFNYVVLKNKFASTNICGVFLAHSVYVSRASLAFFRTKTSDVYVHSYFVLFREHEFYDLDDASVSQTEWQRIDEQIECPLVDEFWSRRLEGQSVYEEARLAAVAKESLSEKFGAVENVVFLHIFRDSPFHRIDRERIFADYIEWISETLRIAIRSKEKWLFKFHPASERWGENPRDWLEFFKAKVLVGVSSQNLHFDFGSISNLELFRTAKRVVTYSGTAHIEAACFGIRPIVIGDVPLSSMANQMVLKPLSISDYEDLILKPADSRIFRLPPHECLKARKFLFFKENLLTLKDLVGGSSIYPGDSEESSLRDFNKISEKLDISLPLLRELGMALSQAKISRTFGPELLPALVDNSRSVESQCRD